MAISELELAPASVEQLETWSRERSEDELHNLLGRRMAAVALDNIDADDDDEAGLYDLMTV